MSDVKPTTRTRRRKAAKPTTDDVVAPRAEAPADSRDQDTMVEVNNLRAMNYTQPSTQIRIQAGARRVKALDDGWLRAQLKAGLLELAR